MFHYFVDNDDLYYQHSRHARSFDDNTTGVLVVGSFFGFCALVALCVTAIIVCCFYSCCRKGGKVKNIISIGTEPKAATPLMNTVEHSGAGPTYPSCPSYDQVKA